MSRDTAACRSPTSPRTRRAFREVVRDFAEEKIRPLVRKMDEESKIPRELIDACFELGIMGIEIPEQYGGAGADLLHVDPRRRGAGAGRPVGGGAGRRAEHAVQQRDPALGQRGPEGEVLPAAGLEVGGRLRAERGGLGLGRLRARLPGRGQGRPLRAHRPEALDHERGRGGAVHRDGEPRPLEGLQGDHELPRRADVPRLHGRQEGGQARDPRLLDLRAGPRGLPGAEGERARRAREGLQDRDRDAQRGPHRDRGADGGPRAGGLRARGAGTRRSGSSSASRSPSSRACSSSSRRWRPRSRRRGC